jgi:hypothetical protein
MSSDEGGNDLYTPAQLREHLDGYHERDPDAHAAAGIVQDELVNRYLAVQSHHYDPTAAADPSAMPGTVDGLEEVQHIRTVAASERAREAMQNGDMEMAKHLTGDQNERADISGIQAISDVDELITSPAPVIVILGEMGAGKTDFACLLAQRAQHLLGVEQVASNVASLKETTAWTDRDDEPHTGYVADHDTMMEWVKQDGSPREYEQSQKLFLGDEWSSVGDGSGKSGYLMRKKLGPLVYKIRKYNGMLIYVAHDESSIHPLMWRLGVIVKKLDKKTAVVADRIKGGDLQDKQFEFSGIPPTDWRYDTLDESEWSWTTGEDGDDLEPDEVAYDVAVWTVKECKQDGMTHRETATYVPFGKSWVSDRWQEIQDGEHSDAVDRVEALTA